MSSQSELSWNEVEQQVQSIQRTRNVLMKAIGQKDETHNKSLGIRLFVTSPDGKRTFMCKITKVLGFCTSKSSESFAGIFANATRIVDSADVIKEINHE